MRFFFFALLVSFALAFSECGSSGKPQAFCDTVCIKDTLKYTGNHSLKPYVWLTAKDCKIDSLVWSYYGMGSNQKVKLSTFMNTELNLNKDYIRCVITDTSSAWLIFNDCNTTHGYLLKLRFNKADKILRKNRALNNFDKKFSVADDIVAYTDGGNVFIEQIPTGKTASMTFGQPLDIDYDIIHNAIDSINITSTRIWAKVKIGNDWKEIEKKISLE